MNNFIFRFLFLAILFSTQTFAHGKLQVGNCLSYEVKGNQAIFTCENNIKVQLELVSSGILKFWYDQDNFRRNNESFAVIKKGDESVAMNISEQPGSYEVYTGDLIVRITKSPFQIRIFDKYQKLLMEDFQDRGFEKDSLKISSFKTLRPGERIYGLGEKNGPINRVGSRFKMWNSDNPCYEVNQDPLYKSIPFFMSSAGYGIFFDNTFKTEYDFGATDKNYYSFSAPGGEMIYYFIFGPTYKQIIGRYMELTGKPIMPPAWALGFAQCRGMLTNEKLTRKIASGYRDHQIPCDIIYQDIGWTQHLQNFEWNPEAYQNPRAMVADLAKMGFKIIVSQDPVVSKGNSSDWHSTDTPDARSQWQEADSLGYFAKDIRTGKTYDMPWPWGGNCGVVDFTKPEVADWWGTYQQKVLDGGVRGFWTDMGEPAWSNEESADRLFMKHFLGMHSEIHNVYGLTWDKVVTEQFEKRNPNRRIFQMTRAGFAGMQRYTFGWSGDSGNGNNVLDGWNKLENQVPVALSSGLCGIPFWSCDISGYCGDIKDYEAMSELYVRWLQFGAFNPLSRIHHEGNNAVEPWLFGSQAETICKQAIELKYQLFPYIYTYARQAYDTGLPLMRALMLEYQDDPETFNLNSEFMFGKEFLVAPVVEKEAILKKIYLPEGEWIDFNHPQKSFQGKQWIDYPVLLSTIPVFVKRGSVIPQMPVLQYIGEKKNAPVWFEVFPATEGRSATFSLYEDDGETNNYKNDLCNKTEVKCVSANDGWEISVQHRKNEWKPEQARNLGIKIHLEQAPKTVVFNSGKLKQTNHEKLEKGWYDTSENLVWSWDKLTNTCWVKWRDNESPAEITIKK
ncbi:MAG: glycosyl hydrolase family 31 [Bacteroidetes bacterium GWB2_41_8]|nr:MAG: glycosyl hydrolase family 31 [Bacteroidetes bacterium GWB2_41_8]